ncbi:helix-turn-helix domain-containing protein [Segatella hominis]|uniref:AlbA family DNA-binding domain-containing protein n=1 Tax=Segatella hominis TaxID=2518605 RepID=UPI003AB91A4E
MKADELLHIIRMGETSTVQFKERIDDAYKLGCELTAFSNSLGGQLLIGVNDKTGELNGLSFEELQKLTTLVSNTASENVKPSILVQTETIDVEGQVILIVTVPEGKSNHHDDEVTIKSNHHDDEVTIKSSVLLSQRQKKIVDFCSIPRTAQEIMDFIGISNQSKNRKKYIANLVDAGILEMTIPSFPKDKKQKYRKV